VTVARDAAATLDVRLEVSGVSAEVVVTASDTPQTVDEVSKAVTSVTAREMEERDEATVAGALSTVPGLRVQQLGGPGSLVSIKTRGLRNQDTSVLIDGQRFRDPTAPEADATSFLSDFQLTDASRVEVLRGSGSSLYGTSALGGVVNVVTDEGSSSRKAGDWASRGAGRSSRAPPARPSASSTARASHTSTSPKASASTTRRARRTRRGARSCG
jgi:outer membrane cobalamin receptor